MPRRDISETKAPQRELNDHDTPSKQRREASVYDAVAGRITSEGFLPAHPTASKYRDTASHSMLPIAPEKALFRRKGRDLDAENDPYWADRELTTQQRLPDSDLLKAIHAYASDFYGRTYGHGAVVDHQSMDETALLGLGILLEEMADATLGKTGDLAFTEGEVVVGKLKSPDPKELGRGSEMTTRETSAAATSSVMNTQGEYTEEEETRGPKRRKTSYHTSEDG